MARGETAIIDTLIQRIRNGDVTAFEVLFHTYYRPLWRFAFTYTHASDIAEDVVQDVMIAVWDRHTDFARHTTPAAYLYRAVRNRALDIRKHNAVVERHVADTAAAPISASPGADELVFATDLERAAYAKIAALPSKLREVYQLRHDQGLSASEIAQVLGITVPSVYVQMARALKALDAALAPWIK